MNLLYIKKELIVKEYNVLKRALLELFFYIRNHSSQSIYIFFLAIIKKNLNYK